MSRLPHPTVRRFAWTTLALITLLGANAQAADKAHPARRFGLIVGTNDGGGERVKLRYANTDAKAFGRVLRSLGGVHGRDMILLEEATPGDIRLGFQQMRERIAASRGQTGRVELVLYYSGHSDETGLLPSGGHISYRELRDSLEGVGADVRIAILDSCASGALIRSKGGVRRTPFLLDASSKVKGHAYMTSSSADEAAQESDGLGGSFFTHNLVTGLRGAADVNADSRVTLNEAYQFAFQQTLARTEKTRRGPQHANYDFELAGTGDVVITALGQMASVLALDRSMGGRLFIRDDKGRLVVELDKIPGRTVDLGLDPGEYKVNLHLNGRVYASGVTLTSGSKTALDATGFKVQEPLVATRARGDEPKVDVKKSSSGAQKLPGGITLGLNQKAVPTAPFHLGLFPGVSLSATDSHTHISSLSLNIIGGAIRSLDGLELGGVINIEEDFVRGGQGAGVVNVVGGNLDGFQVAGSVNVVGKALSGVQGAGALNIAGGDVYGGQFAGAVNIGGGRVDGVQIAGAVNIAGGEVDGLQGAGAVNIAGELDGVQVATVNIAGRVKGLQAGVLNIASRTEGAQIGVLNFSGGGDGNAFGLFSFVSGGYNHLEVFMSELAMANVGLKFGGRVLYTTLSAGWSPASIDRRYSLTLGWGGHLPVGSVYLDLDASAGSIWQPDSRNARTTLISRVRLALGWAPWSRFAVFGGLAMTAGFAFDGDNLPDTLTSGRVEKLDRDTTMGIAPGAFVGLRF